MAKRNHGGRRRIEIQRIRTEEARQVCFSKRRIGVFKKASELCVLCGAEVAVVVYSPAGRAYSLGGPDVSLVVDRFLSPTGGRPSTSFAPPRPAPPSWGRVEDISGLQRLLAAEKRSRGALERALEAARGGDGKDGTQLDELEGMERALRGLMAEAAARKGEMVAELVACWGGFAPAAPRVAGSFQDDACSSSVRSAFGSSFF